MFIASFRTCTFPSYIIQHGLKLTAKQTVLFLPVWYISKLYDAARTDIDSKTNSFILTCVVTGKTKVEAGLFCCQFQFVLHHTTWKCTTQVRIKLFVLLSMSVRAASYNLEMYHTGKNKAVCFAVNVSPRTETGSKTILLQLCFYLCGPIKTPIQSSLTMQ
jgi:hypothetical protein